MKLISGTSNQKLAKKIAKELNQKLVPVDFKVFPNKEKRVWIKKDLKGEKVYLVQSISEHPDEMLVELLLLANAAKNAGAKKVGAILPWLGYSPQDKVFRKGEALSSKLVAELMKTSGISEVVLLDVHSPLNIEYFKQAKIKVKHLSALEIFAKQLKKTILKKENLASWLVLCIDQGSKERSKKLAQKLKLEIVYLKKNRDLSSGEVKYDDFTKDLKAKKIITIDDFISTGGSIVKASKLIKDLGAKKFYTCITHGLLCEDAALKIKKSAIDKIYLTDSYPISASKINSKIKIISASSLFSDFLSPLGGFGG
jgi:ribose-phosphate pyrophosphokinase